jgi:inhibitor of cysteine peptidase
VKNKKKSTIRSVAAALMAAALVVFHLAHAEGAIMKIGEKDSGGSVHMEVGDMLEVSLRGNPSTGYTWQAASVDGDILVQEGEPEFVADRRARGSGGALTLRFKAVSVGRTFLKLVHCRAFDKDVPPIHTFGITVWVE